MNSIRKYGKLIILLICAIVLSIICISIINIFRGCNEKNETPTIDVFPSSRLIKETRQQYNAQHVATLTYDTNASQERVTEYFDQKLECNPDLVGSNATCRGELPSEAGEYFVYLRDDDELPIGEFVYTVEIWWRACDWNFRIYGYVSNRK